MNRSALEVAVGEFAWIQEGVAELAQAVLTNPDIDSLMNQAVNLLMSGLGVDYCGVFEVLTDKQVLTLRAGEGWRRESIEQAMLHWDESSLAGHILKRREPMTLKEIMAESYFELPNLLAEHRVVDGAMATISAPGQAYGILGAFTTEERVFDPRELLAIRAVAHVIERAIMFAQMAESEVVKTQLLRMMSCQLPVLIWSTDSELTVRHVWGAKLELFSTCEHLMGNALFDFFETQYLNSPPIGAHLAALQGRKGGFHYKIGGVPLDFRVEPLQDEKNRIVGSVAVAFDSSDRDRVKDELRLVNTALDSAANSVLITDHNGNITWVNVAFSQLTGYSQEEIIGRNPRFLRSGVHDENFYQGLWQTILGGDVWEGEITNRRKDGTLYTELQTITPVSDSDGHINHFIAIKQDITERKQVEREIRTARSQAQQYLDVAGVMLVALNPQGRVSLINKKGCEVLGFDTERELLGRNWFEACLSQDGAQETKKVWDRLMNGEEDVAGQHENQVRTKGGTERVIAWNNVVLRDESGAITGTLSSGEDITDRVVLEKQLRQAQKIQAVGRLAGGIAHDFNNLLTVIIGEAELALMDVESQNPLKQSLEHVKNAAERAARLTRQLLTFSRRQIVEPTVFCVNNVLTDSEHMLRRLIEEDIELKVRKACDLGNVKADRGQLEQVLVNLVVNARDAMPNGGSLAIQTANVTLDEAYSSANPGTEEGEYVMLAVSDSGVGMTEEVKANLFEPFFTTKGRGTGTGLGLATSYGIVKKHSGSIEVRSDVGTGTTVKVYWPRLLQRVEISERQENSPPPRGRETILLVEDEAGVRQVASRVLRMCGYTVQDAGGATEALELLEQYGAPIDLLLTDVVLPGRGGRELSELAREAQPSIKVLFATGYNDDVILERQLVERGVEILQKPFTAESLARKVRDVLDRDSNARS